MRTKRPEDHELASLLDALASSTVLGGKRNSATWGASARTHVRMLVGHMQGQEPWPLKYEVLAGTTPDAVERFLSDRVSGGATSGTVHYYRWFLRSSFDFFVDRGVLRVNPVNKTGEPAKTISPLSAAEIEGLFAWFSERPVAPWIAARDTAIITLYYYHQLSVGVVQFVTVAMALNGAILIADNVSRSVITVELDDQTRSVIRTYLSLLPASLRPEDALFRDDRALGPIKLSVQNSKWMRQADHAGLRFSWRLMCNAGKRMRSGAHSAKSISDAPSDAVPNLEELFATFKRLHPRWAS